VTLSTPQNVIAPSSTTSSAPAVTIPLCEPSRPNSLTPSSTLIIVPHMKTSPWAKLMSSMMP
jgi:hypothetical protein